MSLHPHIPHQIKQFGEHLFATFLGLLMALALEQWREHRHELSVARQALQGVQAELRSNARALAQNQAVADGTLRFWTASRDYLEGVLMARVDKRALPEAPTGLPERLGAELNFSVGAWDSAKATGLTRHLRREDLERLTETYAGLARMQSIQDSTLTLHQGLPAQPWRQAALYQAMSLDELHRTVLAMRAVVNLKEFTAHTHQSLPKELEATADALQLP